MQRSKNFDLLNATTLKRWSVLCQSWVFCQWLCETNLLYAFIMNLNDGIPVCHKIWINFKQQIWRFAKIMKLSSLWCKKKNQTLICIYFATFMKLLIWNVPYSQKPLIQLCHSQKWLIYLMSSYSVLCYNHNFFNAIVFFNFDLVCHDNKSLWFYSSIMKFKCFKSQPWNLILFHALILKIW